MVFKEQSYKEYLKKRLTTVGENRGLRGKLAKSLNCQTGFISQVLNGTVHFSLEHALSICRFLNLSQEEAEYFMLLVSKEKAGSKDLEDYYQEKLEQILEKRKQVKERIKVKASLTNEDQATYYSQWYYSAIHIAVMIEGLRTKEALVKRLHLEPDLVQEVLEFLEVNGLIKNHNQGYRIGESRIHLDRKSPLIFKHHTNWRLEALKSMERKKENNLHYSSVITLSKKDAERIKDMILKNLEEIEVVLGPSHEEELYSLNLDFFRV